ncbi:exonuclease SbcC [Methylomagnum ishizawai]|uniref:Exonuclease SbcC n=1 Tax=Methylomagnum ishizawai TaxID=1760988 RepID=A0A1Y6CY20_9GAMM|nr:AAA family ATPase [Methylomagnum ishizawai]SMF95558.1 exonuclease SbcC [Methylomagnum ishizawai]
MKILAIRGKNLASLAGEFQVDFRSEPLASAGLFAICGPTGAGKSTLLDALCLALYNRTPRLAGVPGQGVELPDVKDAPIGQQDTRNLLRRGAGEGYAEVEFLGNDGHEYRARWSVWRANRKPGNKLQAVDMSLVKLPEAIAIGARKTEVLPEIEQRLGLSFEQFRRAVLLAQNEFAAFLKADDAERGKLLEALTGTQIYSLLSRKAHERDKEEQAKLKELQARLDSHKPLDAAERRAHEAERDAAMEAAARLATERDTLESHLRWHGEWSAAQDDEAAALGRRDEDERRHAAAEPRRQFLARLAQVQAAATPLRAADAAEAQVETARAEAADLEAEAARAEQTRVQAATALELAHAATRAAQQAQADAAPGLERAKALDTETALTAQTHAERARELETARAAMAQAGQQLAATQAEQAATTQDHAATADWLAADKQAITRKLAEEWPRWDELLGLADTQERETAAALAQQAQATRDLDTARAAWEQAHAAREREERAAQTAEAQYLEAERTSAGFDGDRLAEARRALDTRRDDLARAEKLWREYADSAARRTDLHHQLEQRERDRAAAAAELTRIAAEKPAAAARAHQAQHALDTAKLACAENVEQLRGQLEPGQPCPVCGSPEHPYAQTAPALHAILDALAQEAAARRQALETLLDQERGQRATLELCQKQTADLQPALERLTQDTARLAALWTAEPVAAELAETAEPERPGRFLAQLAAINAARADLETRETAARRALAALDAARQVRDTAREALNLARQRETDAATALTRQQDALDQAGLLARQAAERRDRSLADLTQVLPDSGWQAPWRADPGGFHAKLKQRVDIYQARQHQRDALKQRLEILAATLDSRQAAQRQALDQHQQAERMFQDIDLRLGQQRAERARLFDGQATAAVETTLRLALDTAQAGERSAAQKAEQARTQATTAQTRLESARHQLEQHEQAARTSVDALAAWLARFNAERPEEPALDRAGLRELLGHDAAWIETERLALQALADALRDTRAIAEERRQRRLAIEQRRATPATADSLRGRLAALADELKAADTRRVELAALLRADDQRQAQTAALLADIGQQAASTRLWGQLNELIGSHDGKKFRNYAQQLSLEVLIAYANRHLADLSRRYRLKRVPDKLALMVEDKDMGDEVRSVHSLSGGESFLVSLALALGLAALSSNKVRVESLFIDEGFGSLDSDTLRVAMDALDCLHAQGRKVGVISHVQEMTERIGTRVQVKRLAGGKSRVYIG